MTSNGTRTTDAINFGICLGFHNGDWDRLDAKDYSRPPAMSDQQVYAESMHLADLAEPLGFDSFFAIEHHASPYHMTPDPMQLLTWVAARSERLDLGTCVIPLPWHDPLRAAEQISMLDNLSGPDRKLWIGFGRGASPREYANLGVTMSEATGRFTEGGEIIRRALTERPLSYDGEFFRFQDFVLRPEPLDPTLTDRMYIAVGSPHTKSIGTGAALGLKLMFSGGGNTYDTLVGTISHFNDVRAAHGFEPGRPIVVPYCFVGETEEEAWAGCQRYIGGYMNAVTKNYQFDTPEAFAGIKGYENYAAASKHTLRDPSTIAQLSIWGTPDQCVEKISWFAEHFGTDHLVFISAFPQMPVEEAEKSIRLLANEVLPRVRKLAPGPLPTAVDDAVVESAKALFGRQPAGATV